MSERYWPHPALAPTALAESGDYGALPDVQTSKQTMHGVKVKPARPRRTGTPPRH